jgi:glutathione peroxidase
METHTALYDIPFRRADGSQATLREHQGKVLLVVNVASKCGLTPQYDGLQALYAKYRSQGLQVVGFPANEFLHQEPGSDAEIQQFCRLNYGVEFPVYAKIVVKGEGIHPLYQYLTGQGAKAARPGGLAGALTGVKNAVRKRVNGDWKDGDITWNFEKFLVDREGEVVARFAPDVKPEDPKLVQAIEEELAKSPVAAG